MEVVSERARTTRQPIWVPIVHGVQVLLSLAIIGLSGWLIHGKYFNEIGYDIFCVILTWIVVVCLFMAAYLPFLAALNHAVILTMVNAVMAIFWLAAMAATSHLRSKFKYNVTVYGCYDDGSSIDSSTCVVGKRELEKRDGAVATKTGLRAMSAIAGLSGLMMLLFIATLAYAVITLVKGRSDSTIVAHAPQKQSEAYPMSAPQQPQQQFASVKQQEQQQQQQAYVPPPQHQQYVQPAYSPPPQTQQMPGPPHGFQSELPSPTHQ
ncbi:uncharacterized protein L3040_007927 [Drepanopeziza brunnea f. sp. 'multigermtubi']|uniref:uncharacterized protein n=1 Tax=Drepanopeziza brunnea f. sp. 'multigermtubi' TaxID=698441 RepID=UPI00239EA97E|nr:hypothetical protein L3040_007927 [Drepanopeziza brunnea f. sp. 'multigermtubi']